MKHDLDASRVFHLTLAHSIFYCAAPRDQSVNDRASRNKQPCISTATTKIHTRIHTRWIAKQSTRLISGASKRARPTTARRATMLCRRSWWTSSYPLPSTMPSSTGMRDAVTMRCNIQTNTFKATKYARTSYPSNTFATSTFPISSSTTRSWRKS